MIGLNRPRHFIFIGWEDLPYKQYFTTRNQAKLLILPEIGKTRLDRLTPSCRTGYSTPLVKLPWGPGLTGLPGLSRLLPNLGVNTSNRNQSQLVLTLLKMKLNNSTQEEDK
jgi:hypothetical protein